MNVYVEFNDPKDWRSGFAIFGQLTGKDDGDDQDDRELIDVLVTFLRSKWVKYVNRVYGSLNGVTYESDTYSDDLKDVPAEKLAGGPRPARPPYALKHKLPSWFVRDAPETSSHLLPGFTGARTFLEKLIGRDDFHMTVVVTWPYGGLGKITVDRGGEPVIIKGVEIAGRIRPVVRFHHENWEEPGESGAADMMTVIRSIFAVGGES